jgi:CPA1 family monovalent cation:H+ antiporter
MGDLPTSFLGLLLAAILVALAARRLRLPYTVGLVAAGSLLALLRLQTGALLTHDLILHLILPPLLFEAALLLPWPQLRRDLLLVLALCTLGIVIAAATVAGGLVVGLHWPLAPALIFGVLISATDPVSVIALFKDLRLTGRLRFLVETESLMNDGAAAVLFALVLAWQVAGGGAPVPPGVVMWQLLVLAGGGAALGLACGAAAIAMAGRTTDHLVETALTLVAAYGSFYLADALHVSGVLATVACGVLMGNLGILRRGAEPTLSAQGRQAVLGFWDFAAFLMNSLVFLLIGLAVASPALSRPGATVFSPAKMAAIIGLVLLGRALTVYPICLCFRASPLAVPMPAQHVLWWGGLRGALGLALALSLPGDLPWRGDILVATFGTVIFSVVVQGLTMAPLLRLLKLR